MTSRMGRATALADILEKEWDAQLFNAKKGLAVTLGWTPALCYHTLRSKGSRSGFPDRVLVRERVIFAELKRETGDPTDEQQTWLTGLADAGAEVYLWRPSDLQEVAQILAWRGWFGWGVHGTALNGPDDAQWLPRSLWLAAGHRNDQTVQQELVA